MSELVGLVREFPIGSLIVILSVLWAGERTIRSIVNRNKPVMQCDCSCCTEEEDEEEEET